LSLKGGNLMNITWLKVYIGAFFEVFWVIGLKHANSFVEWTVTLISIFISFYFIIVASRNLPVGTVYAVFVGLGTAGTVFAEVIFSSEPINIQKIILILILLVGVIGLKILTKDSKMAGGNT
jgi:paired small multidrug resistance pump